MNRPTPRKRRKLKRLAAQVLRKLRKDSRRNIREATAGAVGGWAMYSKYIADFKVEVGPYVLEISN
jgi:hypothetical protein